MSSMDWKSAWGRGGGTKVLGWRPVVAIEIADEFEVLYPLVHAEEVEVGGADESPPILVDVFSCPWFVLLMFFLIT